MKFTRVLEARYHPDHVTMHLLGEDEKRYEVILEPLVTQQLMNILVRAANTHAKHQQRAQVGVLHSIVTCQPIQDDQSRQGIALITSEALEFALILDENARLALRACIDQLETGLGPDDKVH